MSGIGFLGAGTILRNGVNVKGLTTAASLLAVTCIGLIIGAGFYALGIVSTIIVYFILSYSYLIFSKLDHFSIFEMEITVSDESKDIMKKIENILNENSVIIKNVTNTVESVYSDDDEASFQKQKIIKISGKYSNKEGHDINGILSSIANLEEVLKVEEL